MVVMHLNDNMIQDLSKSELMILNYVYEHVDEILKMSIHQFAKEIHYSTATILRFCKKLGYTGYAEFKFALRQELKQAKMVPTKQESLDHILMNIYNDVESTSMLINERSLKDMIEIIASNRPIHLFRSGGITGIQTDYLEMLLFSIGRQKVYKYGSPQLFEHTARLLTKEDVVLVISARGDFTPTTRIVKLAMMNHATIIAITPYTKNSIASLANINFRFFSDQRENEGAEFTSRLPVYYIIDVIIKNYIQYAKYKEGTL